MNQSPKHVSKFVFLNRIASSHPISPPLLRWNTRYSVFAVSAALNRVLLLPGSQVSSHQLLEPCSSCSWGLPDVPVAVLPIGLHYCLAVTSDGRLWKLMHETEPAQDESSRELYEPAFKKQRETGECLQTSISQVQSPCRILIYEFSPSSNKMLVYEDGPQSCLCVCSTHQLFLFRSPFAEAMTPLRHWSNPTGCNITAMLCCEYPSGISRIVCGDVEGGVWLVDPSEDSFVKLASIDRHVFSLACVPCKQSSFEFPVELFVCDDRGSLWRWGLDCVNRSCSLVSPPHALNISCCEITSLDASSLSLLAPTGTLWNYDVKNRALSRCEVPLVSSFVAFEEGLVLLLRDGRLMLMRECKCDPPFSDDISHLLPTLQELSQRETRLLKKKAKWHRELELLSSTFDTLRRLTNEDIRASVEPLQGILQSTASGYGVVLRVLLESSRVFHVDGWTLELQVSCPDNPSSDLNGVFHLIQGVGGVTSALFDLSFSSFDLLPFDIALHLFRPLSSTKSINSPDVISQRVRSIVRVPLTTKSFDLLDFVSTVDSTIEPLGSAVPESISLEELPETLLPVALHHPPCSVKLLNGLVIHRPSADALLVPAQLLELIRAAILRRLARSRFQEDSSSKDSILHHRYLASSFEEFLGELSREMNELQGDLVALNLELQQMECNADVAFQGADLLRVDARFENVGRKLRHLGESFLSAYSIHICSTL